MFNSTQPANLLFRYSLWSQYIRILRLFFSLKNVLVILVINVFKKHQTMRKKGIYAQFFVYWYMIHVLSNADECKPTQDPNSSPII